MGRPRKKRKYTRRKTDKSYKNFIDDVTPAMVGQAREVQILTTRIKTELMEADPLVARVVIRGLIEDLALITKMIDGTPPAP